MPLLAAVVTTAWAASVAIGSSVTPEPLVHGLALAAHTVFVVLAFGAILLLDWVGFLWLLGKRRLHESSRLASAALPLIWGGLGGLLISGALIEPDISSPITQLKLGSILVLMLNGVSLIPLTRSLHALDPGTRFTDVNPRLRTRLCVSLSVSQLGWWTAVGVGLVNSMNRG
ncbi:hypothetical protein J1902_13575 [Arthrobacter sp. PO-11]|uniref:Uncharacterized protein n=1 Tax=Arthrobacter cavernae TaxID=2817681 RepID=A0A939HGU2_9MICC|nr:hypothetical protein [Arthrobacter cavernae]